MENLKVFEVENEEPTVLECSVTKWSVCCKCLLFESCEIKELNRMGLIPNLIDSIKNVISEIKRIKIKFFMELKEKKAR